MFKGNKESESQPHERKGNTPNASATKGTPKNSNPWTSPRAKVEKH